MDTNYIFYFIFSVAVSKPKKYCGQRIALFVYRSENIASLL